MIDYKKSLEILAVHSNIAKKILNNELEIIEDNNYSDFHPSNVCGCILLNDDYLFSIRCEHLMWIDGWSDTHGECVFICGNHKGNTLGFIIYTK